MSSTAWAGVLLTPSSFICGTSAGPDWPPLECAARPHSPQPNRSNHTNTLHPTSVRQPSNRIQDPRPLLTKAVLSCLFASLAAQEFCLAQSLGSSQAATKPFPRPEAQSVYTRRILNKAPPPPDRLSPHHPGFPHPIPRPRLMTCSTWLELSAMVLSRPDAGTHPSGGCAPFGRLAFLEAETQPRCKREVFTRDNLK
jgi:hypothetical protein